MSQRLEREHLQATHDARAQFARERIAVTNLSICEDYRAVIHVHAEDSDHPGGTRAEVLAAAKKSGVRVVMFTDHRGPKAETWHEMRDGVLFEEASLAALLAARTLPSESPENVTVKKDIVYVEGKPEDEAKHKLDLYLPKDKTKAPVFLFIHGGAWRSGDRSLYSALGYRFARQGIAVAVMSYRLAPKNPHPAQIEDVADALAWVTCHISAYDGDTNRIYVGGHSAGGHLAALLTLNESYLKARELSAKSIRGAICLSGVYNVNDGSKESKIFGKDEATKKAASPINYVSAPAPPFLVTYCQWDYPTLPFQARSFHRTLQRAGIASDLIYVPGEGHISEMLSITREDDPSAQAMLKFIR